MVAAGWLWRRTKRGLGGDTGHALAAAIEYNLAEYCNLRCTHCDQATWMLPVKFADLESFRRDMTALAAATRFLADGLGVVTAGARALTPQDAPALVVGAWPDDSPGPPDTTVSQDHSRPASRSGLAYSCVTLDSVAAMLAQHAPVTTSRVDGAEVLRVASAVVLDA